MSLLLRFFCEKKEKMVIKCPDTNCEKKKDCWGMTDRF